MKTLRIIEETRENENQPFSQVIEDHELGAIYAKLRQGVTPEFEKEFESISEQFKKDWPELDVTKDAYMLVCGSNGAKYLLLKNTPLKQFSYFIMNDNGGTYERL